MKKQATYKLPPETISQIKEIAREENTSQSFIIEQALNDFATKRNPFQKDFLQLYEKVGNFIHKLEIKRDYTNKDENGEWLMNGLNEEEEKTLNWYFKISNEMRSLPFFSEVVPPELKQN